MMMISLCLFIYLHNWFAAYTVHLPCKRAWFRIKAKMRRLKRRRILSLKTERRIFWFVV